MQLDTTKDVFWISRKRRKHSDALPKSMRDVVVQFWTTQMMISPNQKHVVMMRIGVKLSEEHAAHYLQISCVRFFQI